MGLSPAVTEALTRVNNSFDNLATAKDAKAASAKALADAQQDDNAKAEGVSTAQSSLNSDVADLYRVIASETGVNP